MKTLDIYIEVNGTQQPVGQIRYHDLSDACFQYSESYTSSPHPQAISIQLPIREEAFTPQETKCFFEGLLPEGFHRRSVAQWMHVHEDDYLSILSGLGEECLGAIRVINPERQTETSSYSLMTNEQMADFAREGTVKSAEILTRTHLSLAGASGKTGLYYDEEANQWFLPLGEAPSTHIVKQCHLRLEEIVANEQLCLMTAEKLGIEVPDSFIVNAGDSSREALFATKRYDRMLDPSADEISGKKRPYRLHQEDFAQAMGIASADKYEPADGRYLKDAFRLLMLYSADPIADQTRLWDILVYDYLVGNTDNHIKNLSLLYSSDLDHMRLAPAYDVISTAVYESSTRDMAMSIAGRYDLDEIGRASFEEETAEIGIGTKMAMEHFDDLADRFEEALSETAELLEEEGVASAKILAERILQSGGYHNL